MPPNEEVRGAMSVDACADLVARADPERFKAVMAAPIQARATLLALYAFNVEVSRAPWVTEEPMIAEMRLQWWRDALEEIREGKPVRKHEVTTALAECIDSDGAAMLDKLVTARRWDIYKDAFEDAAHFKEYLVATGGYLMWTAARSLGAEDASMDAVLKFGFASALARYLQAVPSLEARGRVPLVDGRENAIALLARTVLDDLPSHGDLRRNLAPAAHPALLEGWTTVPILGQVVRDPSRVGNGSLGLSPFRSRLRLLRWA